MNPAAKFQTVMELYDKGLLCGCYNWIEIDGDRYEELTETLVHDTDCKGKEKIKELLELK